MASRVTNENIFSEARNNIIALITVSNIPDSLLSAAEFRKRVYAREPDVKASNFKGYPYLVVFPANVEVEEGGSVDGKSKFINWDLMIDIKTSDRGYGGKDGQGSADMDTYSDAFFKTFMNKTNRQTLSTNALNFVNATSTDVDDDIIADELVFFRTFILSMRSRIQVSA